jgi:thiol:disulfide interchange protein
LKPFFTAILALAAFFGMRAEAEAARNHIAASIAVETQTPAAGKGAKIAISFVPDAGWHGYWSNPGDSGVETSVTWEAPEGVRFGALRHPAPTVLEVVGLASYVHAGPHTLLTEMRLPKGLPAGSKLPVTAKVNWLACSDTLCVPETATFTLDLTVGDGQKDASVSQVFASAQRSLPRLSGEAGTIVRLGDVLKITVPAPSNFNLSRARLYPEEPGYFDASASQQAARAGGRLEFTIGSGGTSPLGEFQGVLSDGSRSFQVRATAARGKAVAEASATTSASSVSNAPPASVLNPAPGEKGPKPDDPPATAQQTGNDVQTFMLAFLGAVLGGLLLNVMPCVFPILSLKALSLARSGVSASAARVDALAYSAGTILVCTGLGASLVALRSIGLEVGWSFQLQDHRVILALLLLVTAIGLNLAGVFELGGPSISGSHLSTPGARGSFFVGALSAFIATPCSGPFMAAALGTALFLPTGAAIAIFGGLGLGLSLPFLAIGFIPGLRSRLPRPGPWMSTFRHLLALPMLATAIGLAWVLGRQTGVDGMTAGIALSILLGTCLWWVGARQHKGYSRNWLPVLPALAVTALLLTTLPVSPVAAAAEPNSETRQAFTEARLADLRAKGVPVFVDFTADWCLTCKVNEKMAIDREETQAAFKEAGVVTLVADWTRGDPAITRFLAERGRNSIPYYLFAKPGAELEELPQILSVEMLVDHARRSPGAGE